jgi:hypothetical protein
MNLSEKVLSDLLDKKIKDYEKRFGEITFTNIFMSAEETIEIIDKALQSGKPYYDDVPDGVLI